MKKPSKKYKIQIATPHGWADLKSTVNDKNYVVELFSSLAAAREEAAEMIEDLDLGADEIRVVPSTTRADNDLY